MAAWPQAGCAVWRWGTQLLLRLGVLSIPARTLCPGNGVELPLKQCSCEPLALGLAR